MFEIDKSFPMPVDRKAVRAKLYEVLAALDIGDSFIVNETLINVAAVYMTTAKGRNGRRYIRRKMEDGSYRIWRVE